MYININSFNAYILSISITEIRAVICHAYQYYDAVKCGGWLHFFSKFMPCIFDEAGQLKLEMYVMWEKFIKTGGECYKQSNNYIGRLCRNIADYRNTYRLYDEKDLQRKDSWLS